MRLQVSESVIFAGEARGNHMRTPHNNRAKKPAVYSISIHYIQLFLNVNRKCNEDLKVNRKSTDNITINNNKKEVRNCATGHGLIFRR